MTETGRITILHTNDFHNKLSSEQARSIRRRRELLGADTLLLDAGDAVSAGNVGVRLGGEPILDLMNDAGYDAMTVGNREFHISAAVFGHKIARAKFPILCANIKWRDSGSNPLPVEPFLLREMPNGLKIGVIGVTVPMVTRKMAARLVSAFVFDDPVETVRLLCEQLRPKVEILVALTHIGIREDERLARECPCLDLIVGGHSHEVLPTADCRHGVPLVQAGWFGHYIGETSFVVEDGHARLISSTLHDLRVPETA